MTFLFPVRVLKNLVKVVKRIYVPTKYWDGFMWRDYNSDKDQIKYEDLEVVSGELYALKRNLSDLKEVVVDYPLDQVVIEPR
jgi:hypothetical protein